LIETATIELSGVASNVFGVSGMAMLKALVEAALSASRTEGTYFKDKFFRLKAPRLQVRSHCPSRARSFRQRMSFFRARTEISAKPTSIRFQTTRVASNLVRRLERLGYVVTSIPKPPTELGPEQKVEPRLGSD